MRHHLLLLLLPCSVASFPPRQVPRLFGLVGGDGDGGVGFDSLDDDVDVYVGAGVGPHPSTYPVGRS